MQAIVTSQNTVAINIDLGVGPSKSQSQSQPSDPESKQSMLLCAAAKGPRHRAN